MINKGIYKKINKGNWYRQGGAVLPYYTSMPYRVAFKYYDGFNYFKNGNNHAYFNKSKEKKICDNILKHQLKDKKYILNNLIKPWCIRRQKQDIFNKKIKNLSKLKERDFLKIHESFNKFRYNIWKICILIEAFDPWGEEIIMKYLNKYNTSVKPEDLAILTSPLKLTFIQKETLDRLRIVKSLKQKKDIQKILIHHAKKYYWIHNSWAEVHHLSKQYFMRIIKKDINKSTASLNKRIANLENYESNLKEKIKQLYKKYDISLEIKNLFYLFSMMADWRDERKSQTMKVNSVADLFLSDLKKRTNISKKHLIYLDGHEVSSIKYLKSIRRHIEKRNEESLYYVYGVRGIKWFLGKEASKLNTLLNKSITSSNDIKGIVANKGVIKGYIKIIVHKNEFGKMKQGDIIVTQMTRPEFTPILNKAAAIVTEEGGITCHAAIVSRELNIPCIIGTQIATSVLNDGDYILVDANEGIVRKIK